MAHVRNVIKSIRDPIHGFVYLTPLEQPVVDHPAFQRLRFVLQQSTAYQTYPSNTTNRFSHSLGAAHLAGQMLLCALANADFDDLKSFIADFHSLIEIHIKSDASAISTDDLSSVISELIGDPLSLNSHPSVRELSSESRDLLTCNEVTGPNQIISNYAAIAVLWQAVRLSTLVHDLGHLPMSHLFEMAITDHDDLKDTQAEKLRERINSQYERHFQDHRLSQIGGLTKRPAIHEAIGCLLFASLQVSKSHSGTASSIVNLVDWIARAIVLAVPANEDLNNVDVQNGSAALRRGLQVIRFCHSIIASELDADRLDYSLRDPAACGAEFGAINVQRIVRGQTLILTEGPSKSSMPNYNLAIDRRCVIDAEQFFLERYFAFRHIVYHHNVSRSSCALRRLLCELMLLSQSASTASKVTGKIYEVLLKYDFWHSKKVNAHEEQLVFGPLTPDPNVVGRFDDSWLRALLYDVWNAAGGRVMVKDQGMRFSSVASRIQVLCDVVLHRRVDLCYSMIKCDSDAFELAEDLRTYVESEVVSTSFNRQEQPLADQLIVDSAVLGVMSGSFASVQIQKALETEFSNDDLLPLVDFEKLRMPPAHRDEYRLPVRCLRSVKRLGEVSPLLWTIGAAVSDELPRVDDFKPYFPTLGLYFIGPGIARLKTTAKSSSSRVDPFSDLRKRVIRVLANVGFNYPQ